jgi:Ternary complex associated domain 9
MAIIEFSGMPERRTVVHVGNAPPEAEDVFREHGYILVSRADADLDIDDLAQTTAVILPIAGELQSVFRELQAHGGRLLDWDCRVFLRVTEDTKLGGRASDIAANAASTLRLPVARLAAGIGLPPFVYVVDVAVDLHRLAQLVGRLEAGPAPNVQLAIDVVDADEKPGSLDGPDRILMQRAFHDCSAIHLRQMSEGLSGALTYRAHATLNAGVLGPSAFPYIVKLADRKLIEAEFFGYRANAQMYLPFHLVPRLDASRCGLGSSRGILVVDLVEDGQLLRDSARHGRAVPAIANLFSKTLRGWYVTSRVDQQRSLSQILLAQFPSEIPQSRLSRIRSIGVGMTLTDMRARLSRLAAGPVRVGRVHGDLNTKNILVRGSDAVVIDLEKVGEESPVLLDMATLEASLLVEAFERDARVRSDSGLSELLESVGVLYEPRSVFGWQAACRSGDPSRWFFECVHQIRLQARPFECEGDQYVVALAFAFARKACKELQFGDEAERLRSLAYALAERLLQ